MTLKTLAAAACLSVGFASAGLSATVTVRGIDYEMSYVSGTFEANSATLMDQVWWGDEALAREFAEATRVATAPSDFNLTTLLDFVFQLSPPTAGTTETFDSFFIRDDGRLPIWDRGVSPSSGDAVIGILEYDYATASVVSAVPLPAGGLLLMTGLGGVAALKRRKKRAA